MMLHLVWVVNLFISDYPEEDIFLDLKYFFIIAIVIGSIVYLYIRFLYGNLIYLKIKIVILMTVFFTSSVFYVSWITLHFITEKTFSINLFIQISIFIITLVFFLYLNMKRKKVFA